MADHTDFIRIRGLESSDEEVFQGLGAASLTVSGTGGGDSEDTDWTMIPQDILDQVDTYSTALKEWLVQADNYTPPDDVTSRGARDMSLPPAPELTTIIGGVGAIVATGGAALPAVAVTLLTQTLLNMAASQLESFKKSLDPNSIENLFKKAFLWKDGLSLKSILGTAFLQLSESEKSILQARLTELVEKTGNLEQPLKDLALIDAIIQFGDDMKARIKGKALEF
jgi:hypothetical protein